MPDPKQQKAPPSARGSTAIERVNVRENAIRLRLRANIGARAAIAGKIRVLERIVW